MIKTAAYKIGLPLMVSFTGNFIIKSAIKSAMKPAKKNFEYEGKDYLIIAASTALPLAFGLKGFPLTYNSSIGFHRTYSPIGLGLQALVSGSVSAGLTGFLEAYKMKEQERVIQSFVKLFNGTHKDKIAETGRQGTAFNDLKTYMKDTSISADKKVKTIETIFKNFKEKNNGNFNSSEIWTGLLTILSEQKGIEDSKEISLAVADGENGTKLEFTFGELKEFINAFNSPVNLKVTDDDIMNEWHKWRIEQIKKIQEYSNITLEQVDEIFNKSYPTNAEKDLKAKYGRDEYVKIDNYSQISQKQTKNDNQQIENSVDNFLNELKINKPYFRVLNHNNSHFTSLIINKTSDDNFQVIHIDSQGKVTYKTADFNNGKIKNYIKNFIDNGKSFIDKGNGNERITKYQNFFSDNTPFEIPLENVTGLTKKNDFNPYTQAPNACHHISVMNLLKYFLENQEKFNAHN